MSDTPKHPGGRPTKYIPEYLPAVETLAKLGATMPEIAQAFDVALSTVYLWAKEHPEFSESLQAGKDLADEQVVQALYHRAIGYSHPEVEVRVASGEVVQTEITKHYPPDTKAAEFWLTNRRPGEWRRLQHVDSTSSDGSMSPASTIDPETIRQIADALDKDC